MNQTIVAKFGGSSLADANQFRKVADIVRSAPARKYIVVSAPGKRFSEDEKVTDLLYGWYDLAEKGEDTSSIYEKIFARYQRICEDLGLDFPLERELEEIEHMMRETRSRDFTASRGEYLNAKIFAQYIGFPFVDAAGCIFFTPQGQLDEARTNACVAEALEAVEYAVIPGFYGTMPDGSIRTFSRGGSDITGSIVARAVNADLYENWTDVSGLLMADPRYVPNPRRIDVISYRELRELSYMGASVLHEEAVFPVRVAGIPINIRNTNDAANPGTMIVATVQDAPNIVTGIAGKTGFSAIHMAKDMMNAEVGFGLKVLDVLYRHNISFEHMPSGIDSLSVVVRADALKGKEDAVLEDIRKAVNPDALYIENNLALIAVVGHGMVRRKGVAGRLFTAIAKAGINIRMLDQGASELNIILGIEETDFVPALNAIYHEFA